MMFLVELPNPDLAPIRFHMDTVGTKPTLDEVLRYAGDQVEKYIRQRASHLPREQKEEIKQEALIRAYTAYAEIDADRGWKSFMQRHASGAVQDYLREGVGFKETAWEKNRTPKAAEPASPQDSDADDQDEDGEESENEGEESPPEPQETKSQAISGALTSSDRGEPASPRRKPRQRLNQRVSVVSSEDGHALDVEAIAGLYGVHSGTQRNEQIRWDLVSRMASVDRDLLLVAKILRGFSETDLAVDFGVTREMLSQRFYGFMRKLDSPEHYHSGWWAQIIYALGLCEHFGMPEQDFGLGWDLEPVDLDSPLSLSLMSLRKQEAFEF